MNRLAAAGLRCVCDRNAAFDLSQPAISHPDAVRELRHTLGG